MILSVPIEGDVYINDVRRGPMNMELIYLIPSDTMEAPVAGYLKGLPDHPICSHVEIHGEHIEEFPNVSGSVAVLGHSRLADNVVTWWATCDHTELNTPSERTR